MSLLFFSNIQQKGFQGKYLAKPLLTVGPFFQARQRPLLKCEEGILVCMDTPVESRLGAWIVLSAQFTYSQFSFRLIRGRPRRVMSTDSGLLG